MMYLILGSFRNFYFRFYFLFLSSTFLFFRRQFWVVYGEMFIGLEANY
jgi:hypothetical protein